MSDANSRQVAGSHYQAGYQHWDFVCDTGLHYLLGCASKYVFRFRKKNGLQDLEKAKHYLQKAKEQKILPVIIETGDHPYLKLVSLLFNTMYSREELLANEAISYMLYGMYDEAATVVDELILILKKEQNI